MNEVRLRFVLSRLRSFTIVELMVALVIMSLCLLGVSEILQRSIAVERETSGRADARARASAVVDEVASALEQAFISDDGKAVKCDTSKDGQHEMTCFVEGPASQRSAFLRHRRYIWNDARSDGSEPVIVAVQQRTMSTSKEKLVGDADADPDALWVEVPATVLVDDLSSFSVEFRPLNKEDEHWKRKWDGSAEFVARIRAKVADQTIERSVSPHVTVGFHEKSDN